MIVFAISTFPFRAVFFLNIGSNIIIIFFNIFYSINTHTHTHIYHIRKYSDS